MDKKEKKEPKKTVSFMIEHDQDEQVRTYAEEHKTSFGSVMRLALDKFLSSINS